MIDHPYLADLRSLRLPPRHYALFGSGPLLVRGWIDTVGDLDVIARGAAWERAAELGELVRLEEYGVTVVEIGAHITIGTKWGLGSFDIHELIDTAETIDDIQCVRLEHVIAYKTLADRPKDRQHLRDIAGHLAP